MIISFPSSSHDDWYYRNLAMSLALMEPLEGVALLPVDPATFRPPDGAETSAVTIGIYLPANGLITPACLNPGFAWDMIIVASRWVEYQLRVRGVERVHCIAPRIIASPETPLRVRNDIFRIALAGPFSLPFGHDLGVSAVATFMERHDDCRLVTGLSPSATALQELGRFSRLDVAGIGPWDVTGLLQRNGIAPSRLIEVQDAAPDADVCLSPWRAFPGLTPHLAEYLSRGVPLIAPILMHDELGITGEHCGLQSFRPVLGPDRITTWFEPLTEEILDCLAQVYSAWAISRTTSRSPSGYTPDWQAAAEVIYALATNLQREKIPCGAAPASAAACNRRGALLAELGLYDAAMASYHRSLQVSPFNPETYNCLGNLKDLQGQYREALLYFDKAISLDPAFAAALFNKANTLKRMELLKEAIEAYREAVRVDPSFVNGWLNLAVAHALDDDLSNAESCFRKTLELDPNSSDALLLWGNQLLNEKRYEEAVACFLRIVEQEPEHYLAYNSLGIAYLSTTDSAQAYQALERALAIKPDMTTAMTNIGTACRDMDRIDEAVTWFQRALQLEPGDADTHWNLALALLHKGDYVQGWREYEWRFEKSEKIVIPDRTIPRWQGEPLAGKTILLQAEQGYGDTIQFMRYAKPLSDQGGRVILECQDENVRSIGQLAAGVSETICQRDPQPPADFKVPLMSLPLMLKTTAETVPCASGYIRLPLQRIDTWRDLLTKEAEAETMKVGIAWDGRKTFRNDKRSVPLEKLRPLFELQGVTFVSLQKGEPADQLRSLEIPVPVVDLTERLQNFADTAALVAALDLVISVDTSVAHLSAAIGCPTWVMLKVGPDWRWLETREDSPWYRSVRLFRQSLDGVWDDVISRVSSDLAEIKKDGKKR